MATANLDTSYQGISNIDSIPAEQRLYGRTNDILRMTRGRINMMRVMYENFSKGGKLATTDMEFKYKSELPRNFVLDVALASTQTNSEEDTIYIPNAQAPYVKVGTCLIVRGLYVGTDETNYTIESTRGTNRATQPEMIQVLQKLPAGTTYTGFVVHRNFQPSILKAADGTAPARVTANHDEITTSMKLILSSTPQAEGNNEGDIYGDTPHEEYNYNEINLEKYGQTRLSKNIKMYQDEGIMERNGRRQLELFWNKIEWRQINGRRATGTNANNERWWTVGGLDEYIETPQSGIGYYPTDSVNSENNHIINWASEIGSVNYQNVNRFGSNKFIYGSQDKFWIMDNTQYTAITNSFDNKIRIMKNEAMSQKYGFKISSLEVSGGGTFHLVQSDGFTIAGMTDISYIVDFNYFKHTHLQNEDFTILVDVEKGMNPLKQINYLYMNSGIKRYNPFAHYKIYNMVTS